MATKNIILGTVPKSRGRYTEGDTTTKWYYDNILEYKGSSFRCINETSTGITGAPATYNANTHTLVPNAGWEFFIDTTGALDVEERLTENEKNLSELESEVIKSKINTTGYNFLTEVIPAYNNVNFPIVLEEGTKIVNNGVKVLLSYDSTVSDYITLENGKNVVLKNQVGYIQTGVTSGIVSLFISKIAPITTDNLIDGVITEKKLSEDVKNRLQSFDEGISSLGENVSNLDNRVKAQLNVVTKEMTKISSNNLLNPQSLKSGYINVSGGIFESSTMSYSDYISVESGNTVYTYTNLVNFRPFAARFITAYDKDKNVLPDKGLNNTTDATEYVVPDGVKYIIVSVPNTYFANGYGAVSIGNLSTFEPYVEPSFVANRAFIKDALNYIEFTSNSISTKGELNAGDSLTLPRININKSILMSFTCDIASFGSIEFGKRNPEQTLGRWWRLTSSTIEFWNGGRYIDYTSDVFKTPFSAQNNLQIIVYKSVGCNADNPTLNTKASLTIMSNGNVWELKQAFDYPENNVEMFVKSVDSKLTGCSLSAQPMDIGKNIWLFGDSYMSWDAKRWVYYLASFGYADNCLINAYAGQTTIDQIPVLDTLLKIGKPKYIVWCLGMNDGADNSSPSSNWMNGVNHVLEVCNKYGIVPILATIPTVPTINHEEKNVWVRNSGHRYIDFAKAVGAKANGDWYSGMLDDGVHPTETGARALFGQAIADFAELSIK